MSLMWQYLKLLFYPLASSTVQLCPGLRIRMHALRIRIQLYKTVKFVTKIPYEEFSVVDPHHYIILFK